jgi:hypothetical protein
VALTTAENKLSIRSGAIFTAIRWTACRTQDGEITVKSLRRSEPQQEAQSGKAGKVRAANELLADDQRDVIVLRECQGRSTRKSPDHYAGMRWARLKAHYRGGWNWPGAKTFVELECEP